MKIKYNPKLRERAQELRNNATFTERILWKYLKQRQLKGYQFMRQKPIDNYIVDFYCSKLNLVIEVDGITHNGKQKYDKSRESKLEELGFKVLRFDGHFVLSNTNDVLEKITLEISKLEQQQPPNPLF